MKTIKEMDFNELREEAKKRQIPDYMKKKKVELIDLLGVKTKAFIPIEQCPDEIKLLSKGRVVGLRVMARIVDGGIVVDQMDMWY
jgi:hypothetical protein